MSIYLIVALIAAVSLTLLFLRRYMARPPNTLHRQHVLIVGGSSGIGKCIGKEVGARGANVTIMARNSERMEKAKAEISRFLQDRTEQRIQCISVDVSGDPTSVEAAVQQAEQELGPVFLLVNSAGISHCDRFEDLSMEQFKNMMDVNYYGTLVVTRCVLRTMKAQKEGRIVFLSSLAGLGGLYGYSGYSASKATLKAMAEAIQMEVSHYNISLTVAYPPDTDTPAFALEKATQPPETRKISESAGVFQPDVVARQIVDDAMKRHFCSTVGLEGFILTHMSAGMSPVSSAADLIIQALLSGVFRVVSVFYLISFYSIVRSCHKQRNDSKKAQ